VPKGIQRGRPPKTAGEAKRAQFNTRLRPRLKLALETAAQENRRSVSEEVEFRLEWSFAEMERLGGPTVFSTFLAMVDIAKSQAAYRDVDWMRDRATFDIVLEEWSGLWTRLFRPAEKSVKDQS